MIRGMAKSFLKKSKVSEARLSGFNPSFSCVLPSYSGFSFLICKMEKIILDHSLIGFIKGMNAFILVELLELNQVHSLF